MDVSYVTTPHSADPVAGTLVRRRGDGIVPGLATDPSAFRFAGATWNRLYAACGLGGGLALSTTQPNADFIYIVPFACPRSGVVDRLGFDVSGTGALSVARAGIYTTKTVLDITPDILLVDGGERDTHTATGPQLATVNVHLDAGNMYWFAYLASATAPVVRAIGTGYGPTFGLDGASSFSASAANSLRVATPYGPLPARFPAGAAFVGGTYPVIAVRFASFDSP